ncbi:somatostatin receptor type 2-like [Watersipora subatra]|uniref:somatostatin receptor type 2-like n=1 Tax=Watersipora subatra TaxID=2589382 RepID=UPI00355B7E9A
MEYYLNSSWAVEYSIGDTLPEQVYINICLTLGILLNGSTIFVIALGEHTGSKVKIQLINMAVADCLSAILHFGYLNSDILFESPVYYFCSFVGSNVAYTGHIAISIERCAAIFSPFRTKNFRTIHEIIVVFIVWLFGGVYTVLQLLREYNYVGSPTMWTIVAVLQYSVPTTIAIVCYTMVVVKLCMRKRSDIFKSSTDLEKDTTIKLSVMLMVDVMVLVIAWSMHHMLDWLKTPTPETMKVTEIFVYLWYISTFSSPIIYFIFNVYFRKDVKQLLQLIKSAVKKFCKRQTNSSRKSWKGSKGRTTATTSVSYTTVSNPTI